MKSRIKEHNNHRLWVLSSLLLGILLFTSGCGSLGAFGSFGHKNENSYINPAEAKYFQGTVGISTRFQNIPNRLYYYGNAEGSSANDFPLSVEVKNEGSSYSRGAVFISGFDPNLIKFDQIPITQSYPGACSLRFGDYSLNKFGFTLQCGDNFQWSGHNGNWLDSVSLRGKTWFNKGPLSKLIFNYQKTNNGGSFNIDLDKISFKQREHGMLLIAILAGLSFEKYYGQEYLLAADSYDYPGGEMDYIDYTGHIENWPQGVDIIPQNFLLTNCFMYTTFAAPQVCIDPQPYSENKKVCTPRTDSWRGGQGAPVAITHVTQENTPRTAVFHIDVQNVGGGTVFDPGSLEKCSPYFPGGTKQNDLNTIAIGEVRIGNHLLACTPSNYLRLQNNKVSFTCSYPIEYSTLNSAYQTPLVVELWYGYSTTTQRNVQLKRVT